MNYIDEDLAILDYKALKRFVPYSRQHIARLEDQGRFPKRVRLGEHRVGWYWRDVRQWLEGRRDW